MKKVGLLLGLGLAATACSTHSVTTTARTATEQALLSQAAEATVAELEVGDLRGKSFFVKPDHFEAFDGKYVLALLHRKLLAAGMLAADKEEEAQVLVYPAVANAAIDERAFMIGIPELPLAIPGVGALPLPELALFKREIQRGRNRMHVFGKHAESDALAFESPIVSKEKYFSRWKILFVISFRRTDLSEPF